MTISGDPAPRLPTTRGERLTVAGLALLLVGLLAIDLLRGFHVNKLSVPFVLLFWPPLLILHELGHVVAARMVGWHVREIVVGFGREVARFRVGRTRLVLRLLPFGGSVVPGAPTSTGSRAARAWVYLGGPLANLAVAWGLSGTLSPSAMGVEADAGPGLVAAQSLAVASGLAALLALLPYLVRGNASDGLGLIHSLTLGREQLRALALVAPVDEATRLLLLERIDAARALILHELERHPGEARLEGLLAVCEAATGNVDAAFERLEAAGPPERHAPDVQAALLIDAAWSVLASGGNTALLADARQASVRATELRPGWSHARLLRGRVELELGRPESAYEQLARAYESTGRLEEEAQCIAWLALACQALAIQNGSSRMATYSRRFAAAIDERVLGPTLIERARQELSRN